MINRQFRFGSLFIPSYFPRNATFFIHNVAFQYC